MAIVVSAPPSDPADLDVLVAGLAVGNEAAAHSRSILSQHRVLALLNATPTPNPWSSLLSKRSVALLQISVEDKRTEELYPHFEECCNFIGRHRTRALREAARRLPGESAPCVLVHCQQGISRSVTLVLAYLMRRYRLTLRDALNYVLDHRLPSSPYTHPNPAFLMQLVRWETWLGLSSTGPSLEFLEYTREAATLWTGRNRGPCMVEGCRCRGRQAPVVPGYEEEIGDEEIGVAEEADEESIVIKTEALARTVTATVPVSLVTALATAAAWRSDEKRMGDRTVGAALYWRLVRGEQWTSADEVLSVKMAVSGFLEPLEARLTQRDVAKGIIDPDAIGTDNARDWAIVRISTECLLHADSGPDGQESGSSLSVVGEARCEQSSCDSRDSSARDAPAAARRGWRELRLPAFMAHLASTASILGDIGCWIEDELDSEATESGTSDPAEVLLSSVWADGTWSGTLLWDSAIHLSHMLLSPSSLGGLRWRDHIRRGGSVLELGCGLALPGLVSFLLGASQVVLTDRPLIVELVQEALNKDPELSKITRHSPSQSEDAELTQAGDAAKDSAKVETEGARRRPSLRAVPFSWDEQTAKALLEVEFEGSPPATIIACDCIFAPLFGESFLLLRMLLALAAPMPSNKDALQAGPPDGTLVLLALERREGDGADAFFAQAAEVGFVTRLTRRVGRVVLCEMRLVRSRSI